MKRYIALLRGINVSGKNILAMSKLKKAMIELGYDNVVTYLNSGNVIFSSADEEQSLIVNISSMIKSVFDLDILVVVIAQNQLAQLVENAPDWWGSSDKNIYDNLIFLIPPLSYSAFYHEMGPLKAEYEIAYYYENVVFWSFHRKEYQKTNWWAKTASSAISKNITIRNANTIKKILTM